MLEEKGKGSPESRGAPPAGLGPAPALPLHSRAGSGGAPSPCAQHKGARGEPWEQGWAGVKPPWVLPCPPCSPTSTTRESQGSPPLLWWANGSLNVPKVQLGLRNPTHPCQVWVSGGCLVWVLCGVFHVGNFFILGKKPHFATEFFLSDFSSLPEDRPTLINSQILCSLSLPPKKALVYPFWLSLLGSCIPKCVNHVITVKLWVIQCYLPLILAGSLICSCNYVSVSTREIKSTEIPSNRSTTISVGWNWASGSEKEILSAQCCRRSKRELNLIKQ